MRQHPALAAIVPVEGTTTLTRRAALGLMMAGSALALAGCSPARLLSVVTPPDPQGRLVARDRPYGPHRRHRFDLYAPREPVRNAPLVMFLHGGAWASGDKDEYAFVGHALAARGLVVAIPNVRQVPEAAFPVFVQDAALALPVVATDAAAYGASAGRVSVIGHSSGAFDAACLALNQSRFLGAAPPAPRVRRLIGLSGPYVIDPSMLAETFAAFGSWRDARDLDLRRAVSASSPRTLLVTGDADTIVPDRQSRELLAALGRAGADATLTVLPGAGHFDTLPGYGREGGRVADLVAGFARL